MNAETLKQRLKEMFGSSLKFNKEFDKHAKQLNEQEDNLINWCTAVINNDISPKPSKKNKNIILFIKKLGNSNRCIILKQKDGEYVECHLGNHKYYDYLRKQIGL